MSFSQTMRSLRRIKEIANVLFKHQFGYIVDRLNLRSTLSFRHKMQQPHKSVASAPERMRLVMEALRGPLV